MPQAMLGDVLQYLRRVCAVQQARELTDGQLIERFLNHRDETAFTALVQRHGPMILGVCRRLVGDAHTAEDIFQATFLVLVRRAASIKKHVSLASWLYGVAQRIARRTTAQNTARRNRERQALTMPRADSLDEVTWQELRTVLDEEISRLPEKYRAAIVLCHLEGRTHEQAARELGWPKSSLASRLGRGREMLREQLTKRGIALSAGLLTAALAEKATAAPMAAMLTIKTVKAAMSAAAGKTVVAGLVSARALLMAEEAMRGIIGIKGTLCVVALALGLTAGGAGLAGFAGSLTSDQSARELQSSTRAVAGQENKEQPDIKYLPEAPLPEKALARLGSDRLRHPGVQWVRFVGDGKMLLAGSTTFDSTTRFWDAVTGKQLRHQLGALSSLRQPPVLSPDHKVLYAGGFEPMLIELQTGKGLWRMEDHAEIDIAHGRYSPRFSQDGKTVAAVGMVKDRLTVFFFDVVTGKELRSIGILTSEDSFIKECLKKEKLGLPQGLMYASRWPPTFEISPDLGILAVAAGLQTVYVADLATGKEIRRLEAPEYVASLAFSPGGHLLAVRTAKPEICVWSLETGKQVLPKNPEQRIVSIAFAPNGKQFASVENGGSLIRLWDSATLKEVRHWPSRAQHVTSIDFSPDGKMLATTSSDSSFIRRWDTASGKEIPTTLSHTEPVFSTVFRSDSKSLISWSGTLDGNNHIGLEWDLKTSQVRRKLSDERLMPTADGWRCSVVDRSPDGRMMALVWYSLQDDKAETMIRLWDTITRREFGTLKRHVDWVTSGFFSPDGKYLASYASDGLRLWDIASREEIIHVETCQHLVFSADSKLAAYSCRETLYVFDLASRKDIHRWQTEGYARAFVFAPDGNSLITQTARHLVSWSTESGVQISKVPLRSNFPAYAENARLMACSPTGRAVALIGSDLPSPIPVTGNRFSAAPIALYEVFTGDEIGSFHSPQGPISSLSFSPNGRLLASGGADSTILIWDVTGRAKSPAGSPLKLEHLNALWNDLASDAARAEPAIWILAGAPELAIPWLKERLLIVPAPESEVAKLIADLDDKQFAVRDKASQALDKLGDTAVAAIRKALAENRPLEVRRRLELLLAKNNEAAIRPIRAIEAIEYAGTPEARRLLEQLAAEAPNPRVAERAAAALKRLAK